MVTPRYLVVVTSLIGGVVHSIGIYMHDIVLCLWLSSYIHICLENNIFHVVAQ